MTSSGTGAYTVASREERGSIFGFDRRAGLQHLVEASEVERLEACGASLEQHPSRSSGVIANDLG